MRKNIYFNEQEIKEYEDIYLKIKDITNIVFKIKEENTSFILLNIYKNDFDSFFKENKRDSDLIFKIKENLYFIIVQNSTGKESKMFLQRLFKVLNKKVLLRKDPYALILNYSKKNENLKKIIFNLITDYLLLSQEGKNYLIKTIRIRNI